MNRETMNRENLTPNDIEGLSVTDLAELPAGALADLQRRVAAEARTSRTRAEKLNAALLHRYERAAGAAYVDAGKDTGTLHLDDDGHDVEVRIDKDVHWDQEALVAILGELPDDLARFYAKTSFTIEERKYNSAPPDLRSLFARARTVKAAKMRFTLRPPQAEEAA
jgi:hypothetical protein